MKSFSPRIIDGELPELTHLENILQRAGSLLKSDVISYSATDDKLYPVISIELGGNGQHPLPTLAFVGGIHGVERIGTQLVLAFLETLVERLQWDASLINILKEVKLVFLPLMNPVGMIRHWRANGQGVDLMRNAPVDADERVPWLVGGHRLGPALPWYRGKKGEPMQPEAQALVQAAEKHLFNTPFSLVLDCHSGFGSQDRLWFPYAGSKRRTIAHLPEVYQLRKMLFATYPHQNYLFEPQSRHYITHGDLWDYIYDMAVDRRQILLPLTLEMGSWLWVKKNPLQLRRAIGMFHPVRPHRVKRVLRHHQILMEFLLRAVHSFEYWHSQMNHERNLREARTLWYNHVDSH